MNWTLFKFNIKTNKMLWIEMYFILTFYLFVIISMFDPANLTSMNDLLQTLPKSLVNALGYGQMSNDLISFITNYIYGLLILAFPLIYAIIVNNKLVAKHVDSGSMTYILSSPNSRKKVIITQAVFSITSITLLLILNTITGIIIAGLLHPGYLNIGKFIVLNIYTILFYFMISGITFISSCIFNEAKQSLSLGAGITIIFLLLKMLGNASSNTKFFGDITIYALFNPNKILTGHNSFVVITSLISIFVAILLYIGGILIFNKKNLPL